MPSRAGPRLPLCERHTRLLPPRHDGQNTCGFAETACQASFAKISFFPKDGNYDLTKPSRPHGGRSRSSRHAVRDAMARWCRKTCGRVAYGQAVWSCPLDAGVKFAEIIGERRWLKSPTHEGERGAAVKPLRRECRSDFGVPVLACVRLFYFARKALGAACTRYDTADKCDELAPLHVPLKQNSIDLAMSRLCRARVKVRQGSQDDMSAQNFDVCFGSGHRAACSGHHRKRTSTRQVSMSAWCHKRTHTREQNARLFQHLIGTQND